MSKIQGIVDKAIGDINSLRAKIDLFDFDNFTDPFDLTEFVDSVFGLLNSPANATQNFLNSLNDSIVTNPTLLNSKIENLQFNYNSLNYNDIFNLNTYYLANSLLLQYSFTDTLELEAQKNNIIASKTILTTDENNYYRLPYDIGSFADDTRIIRNTAVRQDLEDSHTDLIGFLRDKEESLPKVKTAKLDYTTNIVQINYMLYNSLARIETIKELNPNLAFFEYQNFDYLEANND